MHTAADPGPALLLVWSTLLLLVLVLVLDRMFQGNRKTDTWWADPICQVLPVCLSLQGSCSTMCVSVSLELAVCCIFMRTSYVVAAEAQPERCQPKRVFKMFKKLPVTTS